MHDQYDVYPNHLNTPYSIDHLMLLNLHKKSFHVMHHFLSQLVALVLHKLMYVIHFRKIDLESVYLLLDENNALIGVTSYPQFHILSVASELSLYNWDQQL